MKKPHLISLLTLIIPLISNSTEVRFITEETTAAELEQLLTPKPRTSSTRRSRAIKFDEDTPTTKNTTSPANQNSAPIEEGSLLAFRINFSLNSHEVPSSALPTLNTIAEVMAKNSNFDILITGHTDSTGDATRNLDLSRRRALSVKAFIANAREISPSRIIAVGTGSDEPLLGTDATDPKNRRVQFRTIPK